MNVGDTINRDQARQLPVGAKFTDLDGTRARTVTRGGYVRDGQGWQREWAALPMRDFRITHLPDHAEFTIGQRVDQDVVRRLPTGAVWNGEDGRPRTIVEQGRTYRDPDGRNGRLEAWRGRNGRLVSLPDAKPNVPAVGDLIQPARLRDLPEGSEVRVPGNGNRYFKRGGDMVSNGGGRVITIANFTADATVMALPEQPKVAHGFTVGQEIAAVDLFNLPVGTTLRGQGDGRTYNILDGGQYTVILADGTVSMRRDLNGLGGRFDILGLPDQPVVPKVGDVIAEGHGHADGLRALPDGTEVEVNANRHRYVKSGDQMEQIGGNGNVFPIDRFRSEATVIWMPGMKKDTAWAVGQQVNAAQLGNLPVGTTFRAVHGHTDYLTVEGGNDRRGLGGAVTHYVQPDQGIVNGGGLMELARLAGDFTIVGLPDDAVETLAEFKARVWRVLTPYRESDYTGAHTKRLLRELGITAPEPVVPEDPALVEEFKAQMWQHVAGAARDQGWCATWKKPLAELGISEPKPKTVTTTITVTHRPDFDVTAHVDGLDGVEVQASH